MNHQPTFRVFGTTLRLAPIVGVAAFSILYAPAAPLVWAGPPFAEFVDPNPASNNQFGATVVALPTGNVVITSPLDDAGGTDAGAVYLFNGATGALISTLKGSSADDRLGFSGVRALTNGNYVIVSHLWDIPSGAANVGAVTWGSGVTGVSGVVSAANSLVGSTVGDQVGETGVTALTNGNYAVRSRFWDNGTAIDAGAVTWGNGTTGISGPVSPSNSLVGTSVGAAVGDRVGYDGATALPNGNYVVGSADWHIGSAAVGAATWVNGTTGLPVGPVSASNSVVGATNGDLVGFPAPIALTNGNYVLPSPTWDGVAVNTGAVTWGNGSTGLTGVITSSNSLVGTTAEDRIGLVTVLNNGNYVVRSSIWDNGAILDAGAATWGNGLGGTVGAVSASNSLVGTTATNGVGGLVVALTNGNYVVGSPSWENGAVSNAGAATWCNGLGGTVGAVSVSNSLVGTTASDAVGGVLTALANGNYVAGSSSWDNAAIVDVGAAAWGNGAGGTVGPVSAANSMVGTTASDGLSLQVTPLTNGNYVVRRPNWTNAGTASASAATWGNGLGGTVGAVTASNSVVGSTTGDGVSNTVTALLNGNYVVGGPNWDNGATVNAGAATWGNGAGGTAGVISAANSLVGTTANDAVGATVIALANGNYVAVNSVWDNGGTVDAGAATWGNGLGGLVGAVSPSKSLVGATGPSSLLTIVTDAVNGTFLAPFITDGSGRVRLGSLDDGIAPTLGAVSSANVTQSGADVSGSVLVGAGLTITARGFVYSKTATNATPAISGTGVTQIPLAGTTGPITSPLPGLLANTGYSVRSYATNSAGTSYSAVATFTTLADPALSISDVSASEGNASPQSYTFTVSLSAPTSNTVTVAWTTQDGSATSGSDYTAASNSLTFTPGQTSKTLAVSVFGDTTPEAHETFSVALSTPVNAAVTKGVGVGVILNDDGGAVTPGLSISDPAVAEGNSGNSLLSFAVSLSAPSTSAVSVNYASSNGTATAGSDYTARSGTFIIPAGVTSKNVVMVVQGDTTVEGDETVLVTLSGPTGAVLLKDVGLGTIVNDDPPAASTTVTQYRLYHEGTKEHLYTTDLNEYTALGTLGWTPEGIAYKMLTDGSYNGVATVPLFRMYHPGILQHHWTTDSNETTVLSGTPSWFYEGIIGYVSPTPVSGTIPLYRMNLQDPPLHLWTTDLNEYTVLQTRGWIAEGIIGYVVP